MRKLLTLAIPMLLGVGLLTAVIHKDPQNGEQSKRLQAGFAQTRSQPAVVEEAAAPTTATTAAPETTTTTAAPAPTTTTTLAIVTTTTARRVVTPVTAPRPRPTTSTTFQQTQAAAEPTIIDCGTGSANAKANLANLGGGRHGLTATVINESTKDIELDSLVVTADYGAAGGKKQFTVAVSGKIVQARPGQAEVTFSIPESEGNAAPSNFVISDFRFHTAGIPECTSH
jgi:cytoskeletal protein RodZ